MPSFDVDLPAALALIEEGKQAQAMLDTMPDQSPYWDGPSGQETLAVAEQLGLTARTTNRQRWDMEYARREAAGEPRSYVA